jgi:hypothetical protein
MTPDDFPAGGYASDYLWFWAIWAAVVGAAWLFFRATRGRKGAARLVAGNALVLVALLWTTVLAAETYLRYVYDGTDAWGLMLTNRSWFARHVLYNSTGFRDVEFVAARRPGTTRVACVGDSFTLGWGVRDVNDAWPQRLGAALEARAPGRFDVRNYGRAGLSTKGEIELIDKLVRVDSIDRIVLGYCLNDVDDLLPADRWFTDADLPRVPFIRPTTSFVADFLWFRLRLADDPRAAGHFGDQRDAYDDPKIWSKQREQFRHVAETCRASSIRLQVVVFPFFAQWGAKYPFDSCHDRVVEAWTELGIDAIDLRAAYRGIPAGDLVVNRFDAHPNERAHEIAARAVLERAFDVR